MEFGHNKGDQYYSHQIPLAMYAARTFAAGKTVVEFGCGWGSTPLLNGLLRASLSNTSRLMSFDHNAEWLAKFKHLPDVCHALHTFHIVENYKTIPSCLLVNQKLIGLVLIDQGGDNATRGSLARLFANLQVFKGVVLCHDVDPADYGAYGYSEVLWDHFRHWRLFDEYEPPTMALSNEDILQ